MTEATATGDVRATQSAASQAPLLRWMIFTGLTVFAAVVLWRMGYVRLMAASDRTYISSAIVVLYVAASLHCLWRTAAISREGEAARRLQRAFNDGALVLNGATPGGQSAQGLVGRHIRSLQIKAQNQDGGRLDQTLLLRNLADRLRGSNGLGAFAGDSLMKLGLLGTIIGFIIMLAPIAGLDDSDRVLMKSSMGLMSDGMAVAMYATLAGLIGSILLKVQYYALDVATAEVFSRAVVLTETVVVPALERPRVG
jgi:MotA/TolQ/ExbB proton channel family